MLAIKGLNKRILPYFIVFSLFFMLSACSEKAPSDDQIPQAIPVSVQRVSKGDIDNYTQMSGLVKPKKLAYVITPLQGKVASAYYDVGDHVSQGDVLFIMDSTDIDDSIRVLEEQLKVADAQLSMAETGVVAASGSQYEGKRLELAAALKGAENNFTAAKEAFDTATLLMEAKVISHLEYTQVKNQYQQALNALNVAKDAYELYISSASVDAINAAEDQLNQAQAAYDMLKLQIENTRKKLSYTQVTSPINGIIMTKDIVPGCMISDTMVPYTIMDANTVQIVISVTEKVISHIQKGQELEVFIASAGEASFKGIVDTVSPAVDQKTMTFQVNIDVSNPQGLIRPGMTARVKLLIDRHEGSLLVPSSSILSSDTGNYVYVCENGRAVRKPVTTGINDDHRVEIVKGLSEGELLVVKGQQFLSDEAPVLISGEVN